MVKCVVTGCPNRFLAVNRGIINRQPKRFFNFPTDPERVKVWLAALRETDKQDFTEQHIICEDHFLPEDVSVNGITADAIPIMPPYLDGSLGGISTWTGAESSGDEEDAWGTGDGEDEDNEEEAAVKVEPPEPEPAEPEPTGPELEPASSYPPQRDSGGVFQHPSLLQRISVQQQNKEKPMQTKTLSRHDVSLARLSRCFLELLLAAPDGSLDLNEAARSLQTRKRRVYDITNILDGINLIEKQSVSRIRWIGGSPISSFLWRNQAFQTELDNLKLVEETLDGLIRSCAEQLFDMTDDRSNSAIRQHDLYKYSDIGKLIHDPWSAYVTHADISRLRNFQNQTVITVRAPEETKLEVPAPSEDSIQVHLKGGRGPILIMTCDVSTEEQDGCFSTLEESRINTSVLHTASSSSIPHIQDQRSSS